MLALERVASRGALDSLLTNPLLALLLVITLGLLLGRVRVGGLSLGTSGVIFVALAMGHFGYSSKCSAGSEPR